MNARRVARRLCALLVLGALPVVATEAVAQAPQVRVMVRPPIAKLGESVTYRVEMVGGFWKGVSWLAPDSGSAFSWGEPRRGFSRGRPFQGTRFGAGARAGQVQQATPDTAWVEYPLQVFQLGVVSVPGIGVRYSPDGAHVTESRAPTARLIITPVLTAADSNVTLRPLHGPLAAPWWERVPWMWVAVALAVLALVVWLVRMRKRRRETVRPVPKPASLSPAAEALAALAALRKQDLPRQGLFAEHAFVLGQILRRFLEATVTTTHPGDTTPELVRHMGEAGLTEDDLKRLAGLLRIWDRVKFARDPFTADEAGRAEIAVEGYVRRARPPHEEAA